MNLISCRWRIGGKVRNLTPFSASCGTKRKRNHHVYRSILYMIMYHSQIFFIKMVFCCSNNGQRRSRSQSVHFFFVPEDKNLSRGCAGWPPCYLRFQQACFRQLCPRARRMSTMKSVHLLRSRFEQRRGIPPPITERRTWVQRFQLESSGAFFSHRALASRRRGELRGPHHSAPLVSMWPTSGDVDAEVGPAFTSRQTDFLKMFLKWPPERKVWILTCRPCSPASYLLSPSSCSVAT